MISLMRTGADNPSFHILVNLLDENLQQTDGAEHPFYAQFNTLKDIQHVVIANYADKAVGCGAIKHYSDDTVEVKRMFVHPDYRNKGIARRILTELELWAGELDYSYCILETGKKQTPAIELYKSSGYKVIPNYAQYKNVQNSVCMKKSIL